MSDDGLEERLRVIDQNLMKKTQHTMRLHATVWLREPEVLAWVAEQFDAAEGGTAERLNTSLLALRARLDEPEGEQS